MHWMELLGLGQCRRITVTPPSRIDAVSDLYILIHYPLTWIHCARQATTHAALLLHAPVAGTSNLRQLTRVCVHQHSAAAHCRACDKSPHVTPAACMHPCAADVAPPTMGGPPGRLSSLCYVLSCRHEVPHILQFLQFCSRHPCSGAPPHAVRHALTCRVCRDAINSRRILPPAQGAKLRW